MIPIPQAALAALALVLALAPSVTADPIDDLQGAIEDGVPTGPGGTGDFPEDALDGLLPSSGEDTAITCTTLAAVGLSCSPIHPLDDYLP
jgi:hypothetical protein